MTAIATPTSPQEALSAHIQQSIRAAIEEQDANALYALAPQLAQLTLADLAPLITTIQRGMRKPSGFSIKMLNALIREINLSHIGGRSNRADRAAPPTDEPPDNVRSIEDYISYSERGNAMRLLALHGQNLRYCHLWKQWLIYDKGRWIQDETAEIVRRCESVIQSLYLQAGQSEDPRERKTLASWALKTESYKACNGMLSWASARPGVPVVPDDLDRDPWLFNVRNGTINLRSGQLQPHRREDLISKQANVFYDPQAQCPRWIAFLTRIMDGNQNLISFLQRAIGYSLTGSRKEHAMLIPYGKGRNGKSTFIDTLMDMLGDYAESTPTSTLMTKKQDGIPNDVARLKGIRFVSSQETEKGRYLAESLVKQITGDKRISARYMHANWFTFQPVCKIWLASNYKPLIRGTDDGIWRRIHLIPFSVQIPESEVDVDLPEKLLEELPGILNWAIQGCLAWQQEGLNPPAEVRNATQEYRHDQDLLLTFRDEHCVVHPDARVSLQDLYRCYVRWCEENGEKPAQILTKYQFNAHLKNDFTQGRTGQARYWIGIGLLATDTPPEPEQQTLTGTETQEHREEERAEGDQVATTDTAPSTEPAQSETEDPDDVSLTSPPDEPVQETRPPQPLYCPSCQRRDFRWAMFRWQCTWCYP